MLVPSSCRKVAAALVCLLVSVGSATESIVQDFDGWKIVIRPGAPRAADQVPPAPVPAAISLPEIRSEVHRGAIQMASLITVHQLQTNPVPLSDSGEAVAPPAHKPPIAVDGLPRITPGESQECCDATPIVEPPAGTVDPRYLSQMYSEIYRSIPFNRAEYDANPSYRHDTAVEFLFGKMRPTVVHRGSTNVYHHYPAGYGVPYVYGGLGYAYPPLQLVIPGVGLRVHRSY